MMYFQETIIQYKEKNNNEDYSDDYEKDTQRWEERFHRQTKK